MRTLCLRGRPPGLAVGTSGVNIFHSASVKSVGYEETCILDFTRLKTPFSDGLALLKSSESELLGGEN